MNNPFELIEIRLSKIESLLIEFKCQQLENETTLTEKLLTVQEAAEFLNLSVPTIYLKVSKGEIPFMKRSKRLYFSNEELMNYIKEGRSKTASEVEDEVENYLGNKKRVER